MPRPVSPTEERKLDGSYAAIVADLWPAVRLCHDGSMNFRVEVLVNLREGVADPQGSTIERSLPTLGFDRVSDVTVGKVISFTISGADEAAVRAEVGDLCARFLTNPVIEDSQVRVQPL